MSTNVSKTSERDTPSMADRVIDAARYAVHLSHEGRAVKSLAEDAFEDGVHVARRAARRATERLEDLKDEGVHYVKRQPVKAIALAAGVGLMIGLMTGWIGARLSSERLNKQ